MKWCQSRSFWRAGCSDNGVQPGDVRWKIKIFARCDCQWRHPGGQCSQALYTSRANLTNACSRKFVWRTDGDDIGETVENYPGFTEGTKWIWTWKQMKQGAERFGVETKDREVQSVDLGKQPKVIVTSDGTYEAKTVILQWELSERELGIQMKENLRGRGAFTGNLYGMFYRGKHIQIVGGGNTGGCRCFVFV